jgi:tetratricopeptide (TPR) repeat protein
MSQDAVVTAGPPSVGVPAGEARINFAAHEVRTNAQGARQDFEEMIGQLVHAVRPGVVRMVAANPGDWGIDVFVGDLGGVVTVWQSKYFVPEVAGKAHQAQIRESFNSAVKNAAREGFTLTQWILCVPSSMDGPMTKWWDTWKRKKEREFGVVIDLWDETELRSLLISPDAEAVRRHYYEPAQPTRPQTAVVGLDHKDTGRLGKAPDARRIRPRSELFVGRATELERLEAALAGSGRVVVAAVFGLGGVGKSTLAAQFAELHSDRFEMAWWVTADSPAAINNGLADLAAALEPNTAAAPLQQRVEVGLRWLSTHQDWLLVLDNLTTPADADALLSRVRTGTIVITSRRGTGWRGIPTVPLDVLRPAEAKQLLTWTVHVDWPDADLDGADRLCEELGWLPLAVHQAGSYIAQTRITPAAYLKLLDRYPARMFTATGEGGDAQRTMARVWHVTLDRLTNTPLAGRLLKKLAWYASEAIPRRLLHDAAEDEPDVLHALGRLAAYSMITLTSETVSVHRLVQAVTRTPETDDPHRQPDDIAAALRTATISLARIARNYDPRLPASWPHYRAILAHVQALLDRAAAETDTDDTCLLLHALGSYLHDQGADLIALEYLTRDLHSTYRLHGPDHPDTLAARDNLAGVHMSARDRDQAIELFEANLADRKRILGFGHPHTLTTRDNLAQAYRLAGDLERALPLFETNLADRERILGLDHPDTLTSRNNVAAVYESVGNFDQAVSLLEKNLADSERVLGSNHPNTLAFRNNLAHAYRSLGDFERAAGLSETTLATCERIMGCDHPHTLAARHTLAGTYTSVDDLVRAIPLLEANVASSERALGTSHPYTLETRNELATAYWSVGDPRAVPLLETTLADCERVLGAEHPMTQDVLANLKVTRNK